MSEEAKPEAPNEFLRAAAELRAIAEEFEEIAAGLGSLIERAKGLETGNKGLSRKLIQLVMQRVELTEVVTRYFGDPEAKFTILCYAVDLFIENFPNNPIRSEFITPLRIKWAKDFIEEWKREKAWLDELQRLGEDAILWMAYQPVEAREYIEQIAAYTQMARGAAGWLEWWRFVHSVAHRVHDMLSRQSKKLPVEAGEFQAVLGEMLSNLQAIGAEEEALRAAAGGSEPEPPATVAEPQA